MKTLDLDQYSRAIFLELPPEKIVILQGYLESYEGLGILRTVDRANSLVCLLTTADMLESCQEMLSSIHSEIHWRIVPTPNLPKDYFAFN